MGIAEGIPAPLSRNPKIISGAVVFNATKVPATALFECIDSEESLAGFLRDFPTVSRKRAQATLRLARRALSRHEDKDPAG